MLDIIENQNTKAKILECALKEFTDKGFKSASLRQIVKTAGVTTGAFYTYFKSKDELFCDIVSPVCNHIFTTFDNSCKMYDDIRSFNFETSLMQSKAMFEYIYDNFDIFYLLVCCSEGSSQEGFIENLIELDTKEGVKYIANLENTYGVSTDVTEDLMHVLSTCHFNSYLEIIRHKTPKDKAIKQLKFLSKYFLHGWEQMVEKYKR